MHLLASPACQVLLNSRYRSREDLDPSQPLKSTLSAFTKVGFQTYPSPPMSDSPSPLRRRARGTDSESYTAATGTYSTAGPASIIAAEEGHRLLPADESLTARPDQTTALVSPSSSFARLTGGSRALSYEPGLSNSSSSIPPAPTLDAPTQSTPLTGQPSLRSNKPARRNKAHVASACVNCKRAHLSCDVQRPCARCIAGGKQDSCYDVQHKKRGRPKLRDVAPARTQNIESAEGRGNRPSTMARSATYSFPSANPNPAVQQELGPRRMGAIDAVPAQQPTILNQTRPPLSSLMSSSDSFISQRANSGPKPFALLDMNLVILKHDELFRDIFGATGDFRRTRLVDLVDERDADMLERLTAELREERELREPAYLPPIFDREEPDSLHSISESDIESITRGYSNRTVNLALRRSSGRSENATVTIRLARTNVFFVTLIVSPEQSPRRFMHPRFAQPSASNVPESSPTMSLRTSSHSLAGLLDQRRSSFASAPSSPFLIYQSLNTSIAQSPNPGPLYSHASSSRRDGERLPNAPVPRGETPGLRSFPFASGAQPPSIEAFGGPTAFGELSGGQSTQGLQLPPILDSRRLATPTENVPQSQDSAARRELVRQRESSQESESSPRNRKRRKLNIHEVLE